MNAPIAWWVRARSGHARRAVVLLSLVAALPGTVAAAGQAAGERAAGHTADTLAITSGIATLTWADLGHALLCLVVAAALGALLAFRPRRAGGPPRLAHVVQTQIMLAIIGSLVMLIVGASLARAFAIAGVAGLVRYRSKIDDPKDASVMLASLAIGLASGVGLLYLAAAGAVFIIGVLWLLEWHEPWPAKSFELKVAGKNPAALQAEVEALLKKHRIRFELRGSTEKDIRYSAEVPEGKRTDRISEAIAALHGAAAVEVTWEQKKAVK